MRTHAPMLLLFLFASVALGQAPMPVPSPMPIPAERPPEELTTLKEFPKEIVHEGTRLYDFELDPKPGATLTAGARIALKFKYTTDAPGKMFVGAMPLAEDKYVGGYQPFSLAEEQGSGEVGLMCGGYGHGYGASPPEISTLAELKATYQHIDTIEFIVYGQVKKQGKFRAPREYTVVPGAMFTVQDKFYLDRLLKEVIALRKRVQELEAKSQ